MEGIFLKIIFSIKYAIQTQIWSPDSDSATSKCYYWLQNEAFSQIAKKYQISRIPGSGNFSVERKISLEIKFSIENGIQMRFSSPDSDSANSNCIFLAKWSFFYIISKISDFKNSRLRGFSAAAEIFGSSQNSSSEQNFQGCGECFAPICAYVSRRHMHSVLSGAKHSPHSGQNAKSLRPKSRVKISTWNIGFLTLLIVSWSCASKPRKPILTAPRSLIFSSKSFLAATQSWSQVWKLHALEAKFFEKNIFLRNGVISCPDTESVVKSAQKEKSCPNMASFGQGNVFENCCLKMAFCTQWHMGIKSQLERSGSLFRKHFGIYFRVQRQK